MDSTSRADDREPIRAVLAGISAAWREGRPDDLHAFFDDGMVIAAPGFGARGEGREACVASYRDFLAGAVVTDYRESEPTIDVWGETAVASYRWEMTWESGGRSSRESGHDVFVFARREGRWRAVWRTLIPAPSAVGG